MSISDWGDVLRTGSDGPPNTKGMSSHSPFDCAPKKCSAYLTIFVCVSYQLHHQEEVGESSEQYQKAPKSSSGDLGPANTITASGA